jgi:hypothetical protein
LRRSSDSDSFFGDGRLDLLKCLSVGSRLCNFGGRAGDDWSAAEGVACGPARPDGGRGMPTALPPC